MIPTRHLEQYYGIIYAAERVRCVHDELINHIRSIRTRKGNEPLKSDELILSLKNQIIEFSEKLGDLPIKQPMDKILTSVEHMLDTNNDKICSVLPYLLFSYIASFSSNTIMKGYIDNASIENPDDFTAYHEIFVNTGSLQTGRLTNFKKNTLSLVSHFFVKNGKISLRSKNEKATDEEKEIDEVNIDKYYSMKELTRIFFLCLYLCKDIDKVDVTLSTWIYVLEVYNQNLLAYVDLEENEFKDDYRLELLELARNGVDCRRIKKIRNPKTVQTEFVEAVIKGEKEDIWFINDMDAFDKALVHSDVFGEFTKEDDEAFSSAMELINSEDERRKNKSYVTVRKVKKSKNFCR